MNIRGIYKTSLIDFPGKISTVLFSGGCNLRCRFCHNPDLACNRTHLEKIDNSEALSFLKKRKDLIDGVTFTGGEPTLAKNIDTFLNEVKAISLAIKLDSNGLQPDVIEDLTKKQLLDYVAIDIKTSPQKYNDLVRTEIDFSRIIETINILRSSKTAFELRTTCIPEWVTMDDFISIKSAIGYVDQYFLQQFISDVPLLDESMQIVQPYPVKVLESFKEFVSSFAGVCAIRGA